MLRTVFIGSKNEFNEMVVHWLSQRTDLAGVVWTKATTWQRTWRGRLAFARKRYKRYGLRKVVDETLYFLYYHKFLRERDQSALRSEVLGPYQAENGVPEWQGDSIFAANVNAPEVLDFIRERRPDFAFAMCINNYFGKALRSLPRHGVLLWHEGITPEYRGLYSPFWAMHNLDFDRIGYSLLLMNDELDAGEVYVQGSARDVDPFRHLHGYAGHKAIFDSFPAVEVFLERFERSEAAPVDRTLSEDGYYTYPGFTDFVRQRLRLRKRARELAHQER